jgi:hypothetical protein
VIELYFFLFFKKLQSPKASALKGTLLAVYLSRKRNFIKAFAFTITDKNIKKQAKDRSKKCCRYEQTCKFLEFVKNHRNIAVVIAARS